MMYEARLFQHKNGADKLGINGQADLSFGLNTKSGLQLDTTASSGKVRLLTGKPGNRTTTNR
jgi:hypothetical protein